MKINTKQNLHIEIQDGASTKGANVRIEAAHSGVINGNNLFYLPSALEAAAETANMFPKSLQKSHYDKTLGYIYKSEYIATSDSKYCNEICDYNNAQELITSVKNYIKTDEYRYNKTGFGVLVSKARIYNHDKIQDLQNGDSGTVSIAGNGITICSVCGGYITKCPHKLGRTYNSEKCFGIVGNFLLDHISFETIPANWETNSVLIADSQLTGKLEFIKEGQLMTLSELKEKLGGDIAVLLDSLGLGVYTNKYTAEAKKATKSKFLLAQDGLLPVNSELTTYVAKVLVDGLEESEDKATLNTLLTPKYEKYFAGKTNEEILESLNTKEPEVVKATVEPEAKTEEPVTLEIKDGSDIYSIISERIQAEVAEAVQSITDALKQDKDGEANSLLLDQISAYQADLDSANDVIDQLTENLRQSLLGQILVLKQVDPESEYFNQLSDRNVQELQITLQDHTAMYNQVCAAMDISDSKKTEVTEPKVVKEPEVVLEKTTTEQAVEAAQTTVEEGIDITDADKIVKTISEGITSKLTGSDYAKLYKSVVMEHGSATAKKLNIVLKKERKI